MAITTTAAIIGAAALSAGSSFFQASEQKKAAEEDKKRREEEARRLQEDTDRIASETRPEQEVATGIEFGSGDPNDTIGSTQDFLVPTTSALGTSDTGLSGLGFAV